MVAEARGQPRGADRVGAERTRQVTGGADGGHQHPGEHGEPEAQHDTATHRPPPVMTSVDGRQRGRARMSCRGRGDIESRRAGVREKTPG